MVLLRTNWVVDDRYIVVTCQILVFNYVLLELDLKLGGKMVGS